MYRKYVHHETTWFDFVKPKEEDFLEIARIYKLNKEIIRKFLSTKRRNEILVQDRRLFLSLVFHEKGKTNQLTSTTLRIVLGRNFILSGRESDIAGFYEIKKIIKSKPQTDPVTPNAPFLGLLSKIYDDIEEHLDNAEHNIAILHEILAAQASIWDSNERTIFESFLDEETNKQALIVHNQYKRVLHKATKLQGTSTKDDTIEG